MTRVLMLLAIAALLLAVSTLLLRWTRRFLGRELVSHIGMQARLRA